MTFAGSLKFAARQLTPPLFWALAKRVLGRTAPPPATIVQPAANIKKEPWRGLTYQGVSTVHNALPMHEGQFAQLYERYRPLDPLVPENVTRFRIYNLCWFARQSAGLAGDFAVAGVSYGVAPRVIYDFVNFPSLGKKFHFIDPFLAIKDTSERKVLPFYNNDPDYVVQQYPPDAPIVFHRVTIPDGLPLEGVEKLAFVHFNTGDHPSEAAALPWFYERLTPNGAIVIDNYAINDGHFAIYDPVFRQLGVGPLWLPSGQCVIVKKGNRT